MDVTTLRIAFTVVSCILLVLFYVGAWRTTRAPFAGWWTVSLLFFGAGSLCYLANGTGLQVVLNPLGNGFAVLGAEQTWCASRSLTGRPSRWRWLWITPVVSVAAGLIDGASTDRWAGGGVFLALMTLAFAGTTWSLHRAAGHPLGTGRLSTPTVLIRSLGLASAALTVFYAARTVAFVLAGPYSDVFKRWFDSGPTTLLLLVQLVTVSFSMSSLSTVQQLHDLRRRASYDRLTGLLRPEEFRDQAATALPRLAEPGEITIVAMADLDHFKQVNDELGHSVGDDVLRAFGWAARSVLGSRALCGRLGGEEFGLVFPARSLADAERLLGEVSTQLRHTTHLPDGRIPTVSIGVVPAGPDTPLTALLEEADRALYRAKAEGRARIVRG